MKLKYKKLVPQAKDIAYAHPNEDACFDVCVITNGGDVEICPGASVIFKTGLAFEIPQGYVMRVYVRSSVGIKRHLVLCNGTGIIDSGYRGEIHVALTNIGDEPQVIHDGERIAQAEIAEVIPVEIEEVTELSSSSRGENGIGSSGRF